MLKGRAGQILINSLLPEDIRDYSRVLDKKGADALLGDLAKKHPEKYRDVVDDVMKAAHTAAYWGGGMSFGLRHLSNTPAIKALKQDLSKKVENIWADSSLTDKQKEDKVLLVSEDYRNRIENTVYEESVKEDNPLAMQVISGGRGNKSQLSRLRGSDTLYVDHHKKPIPVPVTRSYSEGLHPHEYFAGSFGARSGLVETKLSVADTGFMCLMEGTLVRMADGYATPIEDIKIGDTVMGADRHGNIFPTKVTYTFKNGLRDVYEFRFRRQDDVAIGTFTISATADHKVLCRSHKKSHNRICPLGQIATEMMTVLCDKKSSGEYLQEKYLGVRNTYDIEVDTPDHLFVLANGAIVSNSKQFVQAAHRLMVTAKDKDGDYNYLRGMPVDTDDADNEGALLAHDIGGYKKNTVLTPRILGDLKTKGITKVLIRSPILTGPEDGGVYANDVGVREKNRIAPVGDFVGVAAAQAASERLTQMTLGAKHSGGVAGSGKVSGGFKAINQVIQAPKIYTGGAAHSQVDGKIQDIHDAPQGGKYIIVDGQKHHIPHGFNPVVKIGDDVEAGDVLSEGLPNPSEIVKHKGIGEGRRYMTRTLREIYKNSGAPAHRRNLELISRGLIDHVRLKDEVGENVPEDVVNYSRLAHYYEPRKGFKTLDPRQAKGMYLEKPVLHYTIGTKLRPSVIKELQEFGITSVDAHSEPPPFEPEMIRGLENVANDPDWMTRFLGSYVKKNLLRGVHRVHSSDERSTSYVPSLARAVDFNKFPPVVGFQPEPPALMQRPGKNSLLSGLTDDSPSVSPNSLLSGLLNSDKPNSH